MESQRLHAWLISTQPSALFVNGNHDASARQSPISYVCAKLMDSICTRATGMRPRYPLILAQAFFCGQHIDLEDPESGLIGMMRSLLSQLIINYNSFDVSTMRQLMNINSFDIGELCVIFSNLIGKLPRRYPVLCIIDGITLYEDLSNQCEAAIQATKTLLEVMEGCKSRGCIFKLLMTSPGTSRILYREFEEEEIIWMPKKVSSHGGLTPAKWGASAGVRVKELLPQ